MSAEATGWVFARSPMRGAAFVVHLAIADSVNDQHGNEFWMRMPNLARKARLSRGAAAKAVAALVEAELLELVDEGRSGPTSTGAARRFRMLMPELPRLHESVAPSTRHRPETRAVDAIPRADDATLGDRTYFLKTQGVTQEIADAAFEAFWSAYPRRNGKRERRGEAERQWSRITPVEREAAQVGVANYATACAAGLTIAADAFRWLRDKRWADWQEPAAEGRVPAKAAPPRQAGLDLLYDRLAQHAGVES